ncbi:MAG: PAS domain-containing protein [Planctomycetota bacterium]|nr:PAS domain-containing protein [Planctomycetota bacterium]
MKPQTSQARELMSPPTTSSVLLEQRADAAYRDLLLGQDRGFSTIEMILDADGAPRDYRFLEWNQAFIELTGLTDPRAGTILEMVPNLERAWVDIYGRVAITGETASFEKRAAPLGKWFRVTATRFGDPAARRVAIFFDDITQWKAAEDALRDRDERLSLAARTAGFGVHYHSVADDTVTWSDEMYALTGVPIGTPMTLERTMALVHPDDRERVRSALDRSLRLERGGEFREEFRIVRADDGRVRWLLKQGRTFRRWGTPDTLVNVGVMLDVTERREADELMRRSTHTLGTLIEKNPFGVYLVDADFKLRVTSRGTVQTFAGIEGLIGRDFREIVREVWKEPFASEVIERFRHTLETGEPYSTSRTVEERLDQGGVEAYDWQIDRVELPDGRFGVVCHFYDLSERIRLEHKLRASDERQSLATEVARLGVFEWTPHNDVPVWQNNRIYEIFGRDPARGPVSAAEFFAHVIHAQDRATFEAALTGAAQAHGSFDRVCRIRRESDGQWRTIQVSGRFDEDGKRLIGVVADVTERHAAEEALRASEARYRAIVESQAEMLCRFRTDGEILFVNGAYARAFSSTPEELTGKSFWPFIPEADHESIRQQLARLTPDSPRVVIENRLETAEGPQWSLWTNVALTFDENGNAVEVQSSGVDITERRRAELALAEAARSLARERQRLEIALRTGKLGVYEFRIATGELWWSPETFPLYGVDAATFVPTMESFNALVHPDDRAELWSRTAASIESGQTFVHEYRVVRPDGSVRWLLNRSQITLDERGKPERITGVAADVTERVLADRALRVSEERLKQLADTMPQLVWIADSDGTVTYYNSRRAIYRGAEAGSASERAWSWRPLMHSDDLARTAAAWEAAARTGEPYECFHRLAMSDGSYRWHLSRATRRGEGEHAEWFGTATDVHELEVARETLASREATLRIAKEATELGVFDYDLATGLIEWDDRLRSLWGAGPDEPITMDVFFAGLHPDDVEPTTRAVEASFHPAGSGRYEAEYRVIHRTTKAMRIVRAMGVATFLMGRPARMVGTVQDVTAQRLAERELELHREHLQRLVDERTAALEESHHRLRLSERMSSLGTLSAGLGHDIANLIVPMNMWINDLGKVELPERARRAVVELGEVTSYLRTLAVGLRALAVDPEDKEAVAGETSLREWWAATSGLLKAGLPRGVMLQGVSTADTPRIRFPAHALTQIVFNLVQNAGDAIRARGAGTIRVEAEGQGEVVHLKIIDDGPGMSEEVLRRCMEPFFTTKARGVGTGLGLSIVYNLMERYGGKVRLHSEHSKGTTFTLSFPVARPDGPPKCTAAVTLADSRMSAFVRTLLSGMGVSAHAHSSPTAPEADFWVLGPEVPSEQLLRYSEERPGRLAVRVGVRSGSSPGLIDLPDLRPGALRDALAPVARGGAGA